MNPSAYLLITIVADADGYFLMRCVLHIPDMNAVDPAVLAYPMEPQYKQVIENMLPSHIRELGDICEIDASFINEVITAQ